MASRPTGKRRRTEVKVSASVRSPLGTAAARRLAEAVLAAERADGVSLSIAFVGPAAIRRINREYLGHDRETDVVAFAMSAEESTTPRASVPRLVGDIYICPRVAARQAREYKVTVREELRRLVVHGALHVLGYDHADSAARTRGRMWRRQEELLKLPEKRR